jgi:hypothetical protein
MDILFSAHPGECRDPDHRVPTLDGFRCDLTPATTLFHLGPGIRRDERNFGIIPK